MRNAVTFSSCHGSRSSRSTTATFVSKRTGSAASAASAGVGEGCSDSGMVPASGRAPGAVLYVSCMVDAVRAWRPRVPGVREVLHATFRDHAYPAHPHAAWPLLLIDPGAVLYGLARAVHVAPPARLSPLPPGIPPDARPAPTRKP